jgi:hypothetical protein
MQNGAFAVPVASDLIEPKPVLAKVLLIFHLELGWSLQ